MIYYTCYIGVRLEEYIPYYNIQYINLLDIFNFVFLNVFQEYVFLIVRERERAPKNVHWHEFYAKNTIDITSKHFYRK